MKIIITYASCGTGHRRAAEAIYNYFRENCPTHDLKIIDALEKTNFVFRNVYSYGYLFLVNHALWLWRFAFWLTSIKASRSITNILISFINHLNAKNFSNFLIQEKSDFIISTHFFPSEIATYLKKINRLDFKLISVITDFGIHPFWVLAGTDMYIVASNFSKEQLILEGVQENSIKDFGIPIDSKFLKKYEKDILCKKFDIEPNKFTVLIATGSFGIGKISEIVDSLYKEVQILVVCAENKILYARLRKKNYPDVRVFGFIDNLQELMAVSDMIITKPGGLTIAESLAMGLLPIFITAIPGQETENAKILAKKSIGMITKDIASIKDIILDFRDHPGKLKSMKEKISEMKRPFAVRELCNVICQGSSGPTC